MRQDRRSGSLVRYIRCGKKFVTSNGKNATNYFPYLIFTNFRFNSVILIILKYVLLLFNYFKLNTAAKNNLTSFTYYLKKVTEFLDGIIVFKELFYFMTRTTHAYAQTHIHTYSISNAFCIFLSSPQTEAIYVGVGCIVLIILFLLSISINENYS